MRYAFVCGWVFSSYRPRSFQRRPGKEEEEGAQGRHDALRLLQARRVSVQGGGGCVFFPLSSLTPRQRCGVCKKSQYCSPQCQKDDWADGHKDDCGKEKGLPFSNPKPQEVIAARSTGEIDEGVYLDRLTEQELHTWNNLAYWTENEKHLLRCYLSLREDSS